MRLKEDFYYVFPLTVFHLEYGTFAASNNTGVWSLLTSRLFLIFKLHKSNHPFITAITPSSVILMALESTALSRGLQSM